MTLKKLAARLGDRIRQLRHEADLSQEQAATRVGLTRQHFQKLEAGVANPRLDTLFRVAKAFGMSVGELVGSAE